MRPKVLPHALVAVCAAIALIFSSLLFASTAHAAGGAIAGKVVDAGGAPIAGVTVSLTGPSPVSSVTTRTDGTYEFSTVPDGSYNVTFQKAGSDYISEQYDNKPLNESGTKVTVAGALVADINATLEVGGKITGKLTDTSGAAAANVYINLSLNGSGYYGGSSVQSAADGTYTVRGLRPGTYYLYTNPGIYLQQYYDNATTLSGAKAIPISGTETVSNINLTLSKSPRITGKVSGPSGEVISGGSVTVYTRDSSGAWNSGYSSVSSNVDSSGNYSVYTGRAGVFRISYSDYSGRWARAFWKTGTSIETATDIDLTTAQEATGIDFKLQQGGSITGTVTTSNGQPATNAYIQVLDPVTRYVIGTGSTYTYSGSNPTGAYTVSALPPGTYILKFTQSSYSSGTTTYSADEYYDDTVLASDATKVGVIAGQVTSGKNAVLEPAATVEGQISRDSNATGSSLKAFAFIKDKAGYWQAGPATTYDVSSTYQLTRLKAGTYHLCLVSDAKAPLSTVYGCHGGDSIQTAADIAVTAGATLTGKNITVSRATPAPAPPTAPVAAPPTSTPSDPTTSAPAATAAPTTAPTAAPKPATSAPAAPTAKPTVPAAPSAAAITLTGSPKIAGTAKVGKALKITGLTVTPAGATISYQWLRSGKPIAKATKSAYKLTSRDRKKKIAVKITITSPGLTSVTKVITVAKKIA